MVHRARLLLGREGWGVWDVGGMNTSLLGRKTQIAWGCSSPVCETRHQPVALLLSHVVHHVLGHVSPKSSQGRWSLGSCQWCCAPYPNLHAIWSHVGKPRDRTHWSIREMSKEGTPWRRWVTAEPIPTLGWHPSSPGAAGGFAYLLISFIITTIFFSSWFPWRLYRQGFSHGNFCLLTRTRKKTLLVQTRFEIKEVFWVLPATEDFLARICFFKIFLYQEATKIFSKMICWGVQVTRHHMLSMGWWVLLATGMLHDLTYWHGHTNCMLILGWQLNFEAILVNPDGF